MVNKKPKLIIVEAPQGGGKTTLTNMLRDGITSTILLRLSGTPEPNKGNSYEYHKAYLDTIKNIGYVGLNHVLDRSYISEQVYSKLGFKDYSFDDCATSLNELVNSMSDCYDVHYILLVADEKAYIERLKRDKPQYSVAKFSADNSIKQLNMYKKCLLGVEQQCNHVKVHYLDNSKLNRSQTYNRALKLIGLDN